MASSFEKELADYLIGDALENAISSFDSFGRELCRVYSAKADKVSFQNLKSAQRNGVALFGFDLMSPLTPDEWHIVNLLFQKRHLLAHKMGVVDEVYIREAGDANAVLGRKVAIRPEDVEMLVKLIKKMGTYLANEFQKL